jgi:hypothetical protein
VTTSRIPAGASRHRRSARWESHTAESFERRPKFQERFSIVLSLYARQGVNEGLVADVPFSLPLLGKAHILNARQMALAVMTLNCVTALVYTRFSTHLSDAKLEKFLRENSDRCECCQGQGYCSSDRALSNTPEREWSIE